MFNRAKIVVFFVLVFTFALGFVVYANDVDKNSKCEHKTNKLKIDFDDVATGKLPHGWIVDATNSHGPLATWQVLDDKSAQSGKKVLALSKINYVHGGTFNLCWTNNICFTNGEISVKFKAISGKIDAGGGIMWRVMDKNNYYVARFNPLEDNFRIYYVKNGHRKMIATANIKLESGWHSMKIVVNNNHIEGYLDGKKLITLKDSTFKNSGGVGLWTKADASTMFDDFSLKFY